MIRAHFSFELTPQTCSKNYCQSADLEHYRQPPQGGNEGGMDSSKQQQVQDKKEEPKASPGASIPAASGSIPGTNTNNTPVPGKKGSNGPANNASANNKAPEQVVLHEDPPCVCV